MEYFLLVYHFQLVFHMLPFKRNLKRKKKKKKKKKIYLLIIFILKEKYFTLISFHIILKDVIYFSEIICKI